MMVTGVLPAMLTPMNDDESLNLAMVGPLVERFIGAGADGIYALGTAGEFFALEEDEKVALVEAAVEAADGRLPVWAGVGCVTTRGVLRLIKRLERVNVTGYSVITPYFLGLSQDELYAHHVDAAGATPRPMLLYSLPARTGLTLEPATVARIAAAAPNVVGLKDSSGSLPLFKAYTALLPGGFSLICGQDAVILDALRMGAHGIVSAPSNIAPHVYTRLYKAFINGDMEGAARAQAHVDVLCGALEGAAPGPMKQATCLSGLAVGRARRPICNVGVAQLAAMEHAIRIIAAG